MKRSGRLIALMALFTVAVKMLAQTDNQVFLSAGHFITTAIASVFTVAFVLLLESNHD